MIMDVLRYARGIGIGFGFIVLLIFGLIFLGIIQLVANVGLLVLTIILAIIALILLPRYLGEKKHVKSRGYSLKKVKE